jgi:hypothetical protein
MECINKICLITILTGNRLKIKRESQNYIVSLGHFSASSSSLEEALDILVEIYEQQKI